MVLAPTGVAALNVHGQTIHSFFGFAPRLLTSRDIEKRKNSKLLRSVEVIIIDEISMVRADQLDNIDYALRLNRNRPEVFGGVQMIFIGDMYQLPPVVATPFEKNYFQSVYTSPYFFSAKVFEQGFELQPIELTKVYRQEEMHFIRLLQAIRSSQVDEAVLSALNQRVQPQIEAKKDYITLTTRNQVANAINRRQLARLPTPTFQYSAKVTGQFRPQHYPTETLLTLKKGAQVMFIRNDALKRYVNGTLGTVKTLTEDQVCVSIGTGQKEKVIEVDRQEWEMLKYVAQGAEIKAEAIGSFHQYPIRLAWAITVHKSQGKTFEQVIIDLKGGAFEHGQTYVALSRCRTLSGIILRQPIQYRDVLLDERIVEFHQDMLRR